MDIKKVKIYEVDFKKLSKGKSIKEIASKANVSYEHLLRCSNGLFSMSEEHWFKIKKILDKYNKK